MISHEHKCIFVHIGRCAGTSIEQWVCGADWWTIEPETKHLLASQARALYKDYWDRYFKFSIVRNPVNRMISCLNHSEHYGVSIGSDDRLSLEGYYERFGRDVVLENDYRIQSKGGAD